jgi:L-amino acid N-acyltransferase YncA
MRIRLVAAEDAEAIRTIYNTEVLHSMVTFDIMPWTIEDQLEWMENHSRAHPAVVATDEPGSGDGPVGARGEVVMGFGALSPYRSRPAYATTVENSVYVDRRHRRAGVGRAILEELVLLAAARGFHTIIARIVGHNEGSIALHRACGFEMVGIEREIGRKRGRWLDVVELQRML